MATATLEQRIERLSAASSRKVIEPDRDIPGRHRSGQLVADELLSVTGVAGVAELDRDQRAQLSRLETASIFSQGVRLESVLLAGFGLYLAHIPELTDPRATYLLHELGEETRHSRLFIRALEDLPTTSNPMERGVFGAVARRVYVAMAKDPALNCVLVLAGEEIPDLFARRVADHPETDPFLRDVNRYHRQEEARHIAFARGILPELWSGASRRQRARIRRVAPFLIRTLFESFVHPGVYGAVGLPAWRTWIAVNRSPSRIGLRHEASRPLVTALLDAGVFRPGRVPRAWRRLAGVNRDGAPAA